MVATAKEIPTSLTIERQVEIDAPLDITFDSLLAQLGPDCEMHNGQPMPMKFEPWPGGRWFRDLGENAGHWWGTVQVIKPPTLIEIHGPLFMSYPVTSHVQYRLTHDGGKTTIAFVHRAVGELLPDHVDGVNQGWDYQLSKIQQRAEKA